MHPGLSLGQANVPIAEANIIVSHSAHMVHHQSNEHLQHSYSHVATHASTSPGRVPLTQQLSPRAATITSPALPMPLQNAPQMQSPKITSPPHISDPGLRSPPGLTNMPLGSPPAGVSLVHPAHRNDQRMEKALQYKPPQVHHSPIKKTPLIGGPQIATTTHAVGPHQKVILVSGNSGTPGVAAQRKSIVKPAEQPAGMWAKNPYKSLNNVINFVSSEILLQIRSIIANFFTTIYFSIWSLLIDEHYYAYN